MKIIAGNWKMHKGLKETQDFLAELQSQIEDDPEKLKWIVFPPTVSLARAQQILHGGPIKWGAQNCHWEEKGAFTGETSPEMLKELGAEYCLVGHSERRELFGETNDSCSKKILALHIEDVIPLFCVGEKLAEREAGKTEAVLKTQLIEGLAALKEHHLKIRESQHHFDLVVAYEPVWAIGTGKTASPQMASEAHAFIRKCLSEIFDPATAEAIPLLYGGSVKPENAKELAKQPHIDGFLVGGASLVANSFAQIGAAAL